MTKEGLDKIVRFGNWLALIVACMAAFILMIVVYISVKTPEPVLNRNEISVKYELKMDNKLSKILKDTLSRDYYNLILENNKKSEKEINSILHSELKKVESIIDAQRDQSQFISYGSAIIALILAVAGFFGFKSINEIKKDTLETAKETAESVAKSKATTTAKRVGTEVAKETAESISKEVAQETAKKEIKDRYENISEQISNDVFLRLKSQIESRKLEGFDELRSELDDLKKRLNDCCPEKETGDSNVPLDNTNVKPNQDENSSGLFTDQDVN